MTLFDRTKETAKKRGLSLTEVSTRAGLASRAVYKWKENQPSSDRLQAVADVLGVSTDYLLGNTDDTMPVQKDPSKPLTETQEFTLMAAHWGTDITELPEKDRKKLMEKSKAYVLGAIDMMKD